MEIKKDGSKYIKETIKNAIEKGNRSAVIEGSWEIDEAVFIPASFTLYLNDCYLRLKDGCYSNIFVNEHHESEIGNKIEGRDYNIRIIGNGNAVLDGGEYNGLSEQNYKEEGRPPLWKNNLILFTNVENFEICGISCINQRWWATNFIYCAYGRIHDINFCSNDMGIDKDGNVYHGITQEKYDEILVKNSDGIDIRVGCHDIEIKNITGFTEDDTVALTALHGNTTKPFTVEGLCDSIRRISIRHIHSASFCSNVRVLTQGNVKIHDILIEDVKDTSKDSKHMDRGIYLLRIGDTRMFGSRHSTSEETYNITVRGLRSRAIHAVKLAGAMKNVIIEDVEVFDGGEYLEDARNEKECSNCVISF